MWSDTLNTSILVRGSGARMINRKPEEYRHWVSLSFPGSLRPEAERIRASLRERGSRHPEIPRCSEEDPIFLETNIDRLTPDDLEKRIAIQSIVIVSLWHVDYWASPNCSEEWHRIKSHWHWVHDRFYQIRYDKSGPWQNANMRFGHTVNESGTLTDQEVAGITDTIFYILSTQVSGWKPTYRSWLPLYTGSRPERPWWEPIIGSETPVIPLAEARNTVEDFAGPIVVFVDSGTGLRHSEEPLLARLANDPVLEKRILVVLNGSDRSSTEMRKRKLLAQDRNGRLQIVDLKGELESDTVTQVRDYAAEAAAPRCNVFFAGPNTVVTGARRQLGVKSILGDSRVHWHDVSRKMAMESAPTLLMAARHDTVDENLFILDDRYISQFQSDRTLELLPGLITWNAPCRASNTVAVCNWDLLYFYRNSLSQYWFNTRLLDQAFDETRLINYLEKHYEGVTSPSLKDLVRQ